MAESEFQPPQPRSMSDAELEIALEEAKKLPDGMLSAMILLEEQSQLRAEDEQRLAEWQASRLVETQPTELPPVLEQELTFDELLAIGADAATAAHPIVEEPETPAIQVAEVISPVELAEDDFSVTSALNTIVQEVEQRFSTSADEDVLIEEEAEHQPMAAPKAEPVLTKVKPQRRVAKLQIQQFRSLPLTAVLGPLTLSLWAKAQGAGLYTVWLAAVLGFGLATLVRFTQTSYSRRADASVSVLSRASFGVFGAIVPGVLNTVGRLVALVALITLGLTGSNGLIAGAPDFFSPVSIFNWQTVIAAVAMLLAAALGAISGVLRRVLTWTVVALTAVWVIGVMALAGVPSSNQTAIDPALVVLLTSAIAGLALFAFGFGEASNDRSFVPANVAILTNVAIWFAAPVFATLTISTYVATLKYTGGIAFADFIYQSQNWFASASLVVLIVCAIWLLADGVNLVNESLQTAFLGSWWLRQIVVTLLGLSMLLIPGALELSLKLLPVLLVPCFAFVGVLLTENLIRHGSFHEVSLKKGYAFYGRVGIFAIIGYLAIVAVCVELVDGTGVPFFGLLSNKLYGIMFFGSFSPYAIAFVGSVLWTFVTGIPRILKQEREIASVEERRTQIAGTEFLG